VYVAVGGPDPEACALLLNGKVQCWSSTSAPQELAGVSNVVQIAIGGQLCVVSWDGSVACGNPSTGLQTIDGLASVTSVACGQNHACALALDGSVSCWGANDDGQLGTSRPNTTPFKAISSGISRIASGAGSNHTCALTEAGGVVCWGFNGSGQLGQPGFNRTTFSPPPTAVPNLFDATAISVGGDQTCAVIAGAFVDCWGDFHYETRSGSLDLAASAGAQPMAVPGLTGVATDVSVGTNFMCALTDTGAVSCRGSGSVGQLGGGIDQNAFMTTVPVMLRGDTAVRVASGGTYSCALRSNGAVSCWGDTPSAPRPVAGWSND
jgi:alpha-tubulin suppressor-like RCC1 family protein